MNVAFQVRGHCPGVLAPMVSNDGLVVRVRPQHGVVSRAQAHAIADAAERLGNGIVELTSRANLQIRGVAAHDHSAVVTILSQAGLVDPDAATEARRNIVVTPFGGGAVRRQVTATARALEAELSQLDALPTKFGFAIDTGFVRVLADTRLDVRIERGRTGALLVRADGLDFGVPAGGRDDAEAAQTAATIAAELARWFVASGGADDGRGRMTDHVARGARLPAALMGRAMPVEPSIPAAPGRVVDGVLVGAEFGQLPVAALRMLADSCPELRITPWRMVLLAGVEVAPHHESLIRSGGDPRLRVRACTGAPGCPQALGQTRALARALAPHVPEGQVLHVSGCGKGCAMPAPAAVTLVAQSDGFSLVRNGSARGTPAVTQLDADALADPTTVFGAI